MNSTYILYVEDDLDDRELFVMAVSSIENACEFHVVEDGSRAIHFLQSRSDLPRCIITDINMPRMNGLELAKLVRADQKFANVPIVILTTALYEIQESQAKEVGVSAYFVKPDEFDNFKMLIAGLMNKYC